MVIATGEKPAVSVSRIQRQEFPVNYRELGDQSYQAALNPLSLNPTLMGWSVPDVCMTLMGEIQPNYVILLTVDALRADTAMEMETLSELADTYVDVPDT